MKKMPKQEAISSIVIHPTGGLNYVDASASMLETDLTRAYNYIYDVNSFILNTRPGLVGVTSAVVASSAIRKIYSFVKSSTESWLMGAIGDQLYYLSDSAWASTGVTLNDTTTVPGMLAFNGKLLVGDGADIKTWDGSSAGIISSAGHPHPTALIEIKGHVAANSTADLDGIYFSSIEDEQVWSAGTSEGVRAGYKDGMSVNALAVGPGGNDIIVSKTEGTKKTLYRINVESATSTDWYAVPVSVNNASQTNCLLSALNEVYFCDTNGFKSLKGVMEYGNIQITATGRKINQVFTGEPAVDEVSFLPLYNSIWCLFASSGRIFVYHPMNNAFTDLLFRPGRIRSVCQHGTTVYLAGDDGFLYKLDSTVATDMSGVEVGTNFITLSQTKVFTFPEAAVLRRLKVYITPILSGSLDVFVSVSDVEKKLMTITLPAEGERVVDATEKVYVATSEVYVMGTDPFFTVSYNKYRSMGMAFKFSSTSGRFGINQIEAEFGLVGGH